MANVTNSNVDYVEGDDEEFEQLYQEFAIKQLEEDSRKPKNRPKSKEPVGVFPTVLGFRLRDEILLLGDHLLVHRSVLISPSSALGNNSQQPSPIFNDQGAQTAKRAKRCAKIGKQIVTAVKNGGLDTVLNTALTDILERAEILRVPREILDRSTKKACEKGQEAFIEKLYKVKGLDGLEMVVEVLTDDVNRSEAAVRKVVKDQGGKMRASDSIMSDFKRAWVVYVKVTDAVLDQISMLASDSGAARPTVYKDGSERYYKIICETEKIYTRFGPKLLEKGIAFESDYELLPLRTNSEVGGLETVVNDVIMARLLDLDDVDAVYTNRE